MFLDLLRKRKETLEQQINVLDNMGIRLNAGITINEILQIFDRKEIESKPYILLLMAMGGEMECSKNQWLPLSNDIWHFDTECIEDNGAYIEIVKRLSKMTKEFLKLDDINDFVDVENNIAWVSFEYNEQAYKWDLKVDNDWFDMTLIQKLNGLITQSEYDKKFTVAVLDQSCLIGFFNAETMEKLNNLCKLEFKTLL
ncbi:hypothetical protein EDD66_10214 [Mobilisporobacter senegalensis]|uniref:Uncharacterized protein n=1 Tax=Mobilisporobacter senegalensis TaxID=1329262 RepID=A0A3N1XUS3_9FIRM|nr:hypothetical protein [Mobilisporobacter senegalensis]ROR30363.1 hypothetical protein EDD66_10214 [Mobilisporobacter senegalensis]